MLISGDLNRLVPLRQWDLPRPAQSEAEQLAAYHPAVDKTSQEPLTQRPVLQAEDIERFSNKNRTRRDMTLDDRSSRARRALDAYHEVSTNQERDYVRAVFGVDLFA